MLVLGRLHKNLEWCSQKYSSRQSWLRNLTYVILHDKNAEVQVLTEDTSLSNI